MSVSLDVNVLPWLSLQKASRVRRTQSYFVIPAFQNIMPEWKTASMPVYLITYAVSNNFTIPTLPAKPATANFIPCIKWRSGSTVYRYKLWDDTAGILYVPIYAGEKIGKNFQIEVWSTETSNYPMDILQNASAIEVGTSIHALPSSYTASDTDIQLSAASSIISGVYIHLLGDTLPWTQTDSQIGADNT